MDEEKIINAISKMVANKANIDYYGVSGAEICDWLESKKSSEHAALQFAIEILNNHGYINTAKCLEKYFNYAPSPDDAERKQLYSDGFDTARKALAGTFMQYLDEHRPEGKMCLSNGECAQLQEAFKNGDVETIVKYINKYQKPAEWSEEDEHYFQNLIMAVDSTFSDGNTKNWLQNRLKSLRPQPHWKPSEEQMQSLEYFIKLWGNSDGQLEYINVFNDVKTLYNDLKKML